MSNEKQEDGTIIEFLTGWKSFNGIWFGETKDVNGNQLPKFWWRSHLTEYVSKLTPHSVDGEYWKKRCELAERYIKESPCDPDITGEQIVAWKEFQEYIREGSAPQEQPVIIPSNVLIQKGLSKGEEAPQETKQRIYINENWSKEEIIQAVTEYNDGIKEDVYINCPECNTRIVHKANVINLKESEPKQPSELRWVDNPESKVGGKMLVSVEQPSERQINYRDSMMVNGGNTDAEKIEWLLQQLEGRGSEGEGAKPDGRETGDN